MELGVNFPFVGLQHGECVVSSELETSLRLKVGDTVKVTFSATHMLNLMLGKVN